MQIKEGYLSREGEGLGEIDSRVSVLHWRRLLASRAVFWQGIFIGMLTLVTLHSDTYLD